MAEAVHKLDPIPGSFLAILHQCASHENLAEIDPQPSTAEWQAFVNYARASPSPECASALGSCYYCGVGVAESAQEAVRLFRCAADLGNAQAQCKLGWCFEIGEGIDLDMQEAVRLYRLAEEQGHPRATFNLGLCHEKGEGVDRDLEQAVRLFRLAAQRGHADAQSVLNRLLCRLQKRGEGGGGS
jgi:TPR repeat protein